MMVRVIKHPTSADIRKKVRQEVRELCDRFPIYEDLAIA